MKFDDRHALRRDNGDVLRKALDLEVVGKKRAWATNDSIEKADRKTYWTKTRSCHLQIKVVQCCT